LIPLASIGQRYVWDLPVSIDNPHWKRREERENFETVGVRMMWSTSFIGYVRIAVGDSYSVVDTFE
jgi:hypothetical protein